MLPAESTRASEEDPPDPELRPQGEPVPVGPSPGPAATATVRSGEAGADDVAEYEPL